MGAERYQGGSRGLQDRFATRRLADRPDERADRDPLAAGVLSAGDPAARRAGG